MIDLIDISIQFAGNYLFEHVNLRINDSDKIAMVGANGSGKSTLLKILSNQIPPESGNIQKPKKMEVGFLPQEILNLAGKSLFEEVKTSYGNIHSIEKREEQLTKDLAETEDEIKHHELLVELGELSDLKEEKNFYKAESEIKKVLSGLGFEEKDYLRNTEEFSGGWQMRIELAKILLGSFNCILLDEPTNHLDIDSLEWLIQFLQNYKGALIIVSHDRHFVNKVTSKTLEIYNKKVTFYKGNYESFLTFKEERLQQLLAEYTNQRKKIAQTERFIERFRYKNTKASQVQSRVKQLEKIEKIEIPDLESEINIRFPDPPRSGVIPIELTDVSKSYDDLNVISDFDLQIERNDKIVFLGPNGAGKSTLAKLIAGKIPQTSGEIKLGHNTAISYYAQEVADNLSSENTVLESVSGISKERTETQLRTILGSFLFVGNDVYKKIKVLSGGEKSRVALSKILLTKANVIILDEPTNHLDYDSKKILQQALVDFKGTLIIISHDIDFIRPIADKVIELRMGVIKVYPGDIDYYLFKRKELQNQQVPSESKEKKVLPQNTSKERKRLEAELRQKRYQATKEIISEIEVIEEKIERMENFKKELELKLSDSDIFSKPQQAKEVNLKYETVKSDLDKLTHIWTELSEKLEEIESQFE